jgi:hypothetical protein
MRKRRKYKPRTPRTPSLRLHKPSGQAVVTLNGHDHYLGRFGDSEISQKYHALIAEFLANSRTLPSEPTEMTIAELCLLYWKHASSYYVDREGQPTSTMIWVKESIRTLRRLYGSEPVSDFGPLKLRACCQTWIDRGLSRVEEEKSS